MVKKTYVIDDLGIKGGGVYCFMPFDNVDKKGMAVFKVGMSINFKNRIESYHTYFPNGVYMIEFLEEPPIPKEWNPKKEGKISNYYKKLEKIVIDDIDKQLKEDNKLGKRITTSTRVKKGGKTEWFYTKVGVIREAFKVAQHYANSVSKKYKLHDNNLHPFTINNRELNNKLVKDEETSSYVGKLVFM
jgi:hypothetical protein